MSETSPKSSDPESEALHAYYGDGKEQGRLSSPGGQLEFERTKEAILRHLPPAPAIVADVGGGPGKYALWLATLGYSVEHRDVVPAHVEQLRTAAAPGLEFRSEIGDARRLDLGHESMDAVLLLGPLYHLRKRADRLEALRQARKVLRPGGFLFISAISRWAARLDGVLKKRIYLEYPEAEALVAQVERTGYIPPLFPGDFSGYSHRPAQLRSEVSRAGLEVMDLVGLEGPAAFLNDLDERMSDEHARHVVLEAARSLERVPELLGAGPHMLVTARRPKGGGT